MRKLFPITRFMRTRSRISAGAICLLMMLLAMTCEAYAGSKRVLFLRVTFADATNEPISYSTGQQILDNEVEPFFRDMSFGQEDIEIELSQKTYSLPQTAGYYTNNLSSAWLGARTVAALDYNLAAYNDVGIVFPDLPLPWGGKAGPGEIYINGGRSFTNYIISHELGHTYKLGHANLWKTADPSPIGPGFDQEYGDVFDMMGSGAAPQAHISPRSKYFLGWLNDTNVKLVERSGVFRLRCFDNPNANLKETLALKISRSDGKNYWLGLRGQFLQSPGYGKGICFNWVYDYWYPNSTLVMSPGNTDPYNSPLREGATFLDAEEGLKVTAGTIQGSGINATIDVTVTINRPVNSLNLWGLNTYGQNRRPAHSENIVAVALAESQSLGLRSDGTVVQWGSIYHDIEPPADLNDVVRVACSEYFSLALRSNGTVRHWGHQYGHTIEAETNVVEIAAGDLHAVALHADGTVTTHGDNFYGQCNTPADLKDVVAIAAGASHSMALRRDGTVVAWGRSVYGITTVPEGLLGVTAIACEGSACVALKADGSVVRWGYDLGSDIYGTYIPKPSNLGKVRRIAAGRYFILAELEAGGLVAWGSNGYGQCNLPYVNASQIGTIVAGRSNGAILTFRPLPTYPPVPPPPPLPPDPTPPTLPTPTTPPAPPSPPTFPPTQPYSVTAIAKPAGKGRVLGLGEYPEGQKVVLRAVGRKGGKFVKWTENGKLVSRKAVYQFSATESRNLVATFR